MIEEHKYYTPSPEDFRIGFELEYLVKGASWTHYKLKYAGEISFLTGNINGTIDVRVPYLTAEQIEAEGWSPANSVTDSIFNKGHSYLVLQEDHKARITNGKESIYRGSMRCVNDLRLISKLLGI